MTREEAKRVLEIHLEHWQRLTKEKICTEQEGAETISALNMAIEVLKNFDYYKSQCKSYEETIKKLTETLNQQRWIPVSERLPKSCGMYIVTRKIYDCPDTAPIIMSDESWFDGQNTWHNDNRINHKRGYLSDVIAWMPLPEPYKAESEDD